MPSIVQRLDYSSDLTKNVAIMQELVLDNFE